MSDSKDFNEYYSSVDKNLLENMFKNNNLKNLISLSTKTDLHVFNKKNKKWQLKSKDKLLKECNQIKKKEIKESSLMLSNLAKLSKINEYNSVSDIYSNLQSKIASIDKIVDCINNIGLSSESNDKESNENFKPNIVRFDEIGKDADTQVKNKKNGSNEKIITGIKLELKLKPNKLDPNKLELKPNKLEQIKLNLDNDTRNDTRSSSLSSENYIECYGNC